MLLAEVQPHPDNLQFFGLNRFNDVDFLAVPRTDPDDDQKMDFKYFYCGKCKKWLKMSNTIGNINSHIKSCHANLIRPTVAERITDQQRISYGRKYVLLNGLPFATVENKYFMKLCPSCGDRKFMSTLCSQVAKDVRLNIRRKLTDAENIYITADEWTDSAVQQYLGVHAVCVGGGKYYNVCLAHEPLTDIHADADSLKDTLERILTQYGINGKVEGIVTDTAAVMKSLAEKIGLAWSPCFCHVMNLIMEDIVDSCENLLSLLFQLQSHLGRSTVFHNYLIQNGSKTFSLPSHTATRWYSLYKLLKNTFVLKQMIINFMARNDAPHEEIGTIPVQFWIDIENLLTIFATAKAGMETLESDEFGTMSQVIDVFRMLNYIVHERLNDQYYEEIVLDFDNSYNTRWISYYNDYRNDLIVATRLNPYIKTLTPQEIADADAILTAEIATIPDPPRPVRAPANNPRIGINVETFRGAQVQGAPVNEIQTYQVANHIGSGTDVFNFWIKNTQLPKMKKIALSRLLRPATSATAERGFSKAKKVLSVYRMAINRERGADAVLIATNPEVADEYIH